MSGKFTVDSIDGITVVRFKSKPTKNDFIAAYQEVAKVDQRGLRLWNLSCGTNVSFAELEELGEIGKQIFPGPSSVAVVAPEDLTFGFARVHEIYRANANYYTQTFRTEAEALAWLRLISSKG